MSVYDQWKAAAVKKLKEPMAANASEKLWKNAYIRNLSPEQAAIEIDTHWYNRLSPKARKLRNSQGR
jgi:hypothetical protein